jgi:hypothetical protein
MRRLSALAIGVALLAAGCTSSSSTSPSTTTPTKPTFTADLKPANETPAVVGPEVSGSGTSTMTFDLTKDGAGNITAASVTFVVNLSGFPAGTPINAAHIHEGPTGCACPVRISTNITAGQVVLTSGSGSFTAVTSGVDPALAQAILNNPAGYYFNVHSTQNPGGAARGPLVKVQ